MEFNKVVEAHPIEDEATWNQRKEQFTAEVDKVIEKLGLNGIEPMMGVAKEIDIIDQSRSLQRYAYGLMCSILRNHCTEQMTKEERRALKLLPSQHAVTGVEITMPGEIGFKVINKAGSELFFRYRVDYFNLITKANHRWYFGRI